MFVSSYWNKPLVFVFFWYLLACKTSKIQLNKHYLLTPLCAWLSPTSQVCVYYGVPRAEAPPLTLVTHTAKAGTQAMPRAFGFAELPSPPHLP